MKKSLLILLVLMLTFALPIVSADASLTSSLISYEPIPAQPGQYITAYINLKNVGNDDASNAMIEVLDEFPFTVVGESSVSVGIIKSQKSYVEDFRIKVDSQAAVGNNELRVRYSHDGVNWQKRSFNVEVKSNDASLSIVDVEVNPEEIAPGTGGVLSLKIKNTENIVLRNIGVKLGLAGSFDSEFYDLPFIPTTSATEQKIGKLNPNEMSDVSFTIKAYPSANPGYYKLPILITFYDDQGTKTEMEEVIGIVIKAVPDLTVYLEKTEIADINQPGKITLKFVNKGVGDLKFLDVKLLQSDSYEIISTDREYVGDLDSDDYRSESFTIIPSEEDFDINIDVSYKDENNNEYAKTLGVPFHKNKTVSNGSSAPSFSTILLILVVLLVIIFWIRRRRKHKHLHK